MNFFQAIFLGLVQALTEYLPVSSSAHIRIIGDLMLGSDPGAAFTAIIQIGTELAVILYFRHDIIRILGAWFGSLFGKEGKDFKSRMGAHNRDTQMGWFIIIGTLPILIAGLLFKDAIESTLRNLWITVTVLIIFGILLWVVDARAKQVKTMDEMTWKDALIFGIGQMLALIPGVSRSGGTITFGRAMGYTREAAVRVSFLMAIPAVFGAGILEAVSAVKDVAAGNAGMFPGWGCDHRGHHRGVRGRLCGDHRLPEVRVHLLVQGVRHLPHRAGRCRGSAADLRRAAPDGSRCRRVSVIRRK